MSTFDVAVIGAGITGVAAALAAQQRGARTCIIGRAPGATALASGAWSGPLRAELRSAFASAGLSLERVTGSLAHERGHIVKCDFAAASHARATITSGTVVGGIFGLPQFHAAILARRWQPTAPLAAHTIRFADVPAAGWTALSLAAYIEQRPAVLAALLPRAEAVILPPVLGIERHTEVMSELAATGVQVAEALAATPSIPGWRLQRALAKTLSTNNIPVFEGRASAERVEGKRVVSVRTPDQSISARSFVLATGKFIGGGISGNSEFTEGVFDLPVWLEQLGDVFSAADALPLTDPVRSEEQVLLGAGVHTDERLRPVNRALDVVYENVFAAGTVRAGWNTAQAGLGHCAEEGWMAGMSASA